MAKSLNFRDVFESIGWYTIRELHIQINNGIASVVHPPRRIPIALQAAAKKELDCSEIFWL